MFWNKKAKAQPLGVPLEDVLGMLRDTTLRPRIEGNVLLADHGSAVTRVEVLQPAQRESGNGAIQAVVRIVTELPAALQPMFAEPSTRMAMNGFASLGALCRDGASVSVGSRWWGRN